MCGQAKQTKTVSEVLAPILLQYGWNINEVDVYVDEDTTIAGAGDDKVDLGCNVAVIDNKRLFVVQKSSSDIEKVCIKLNYIPDSHPVIIGGREEYK